jgi:hypothetical protein
MNMKVNPLNRNRNIGTQSTGLNRAVGFLWQW